MFSSGCDLWFVPVDGAFDAFGVEHWGFCFSCYECIVEIWVVGDFCSINPCWVVCPVSA